MSARQSNTHTGHPTTPTQLGGVGVQRADPGHPHRTAAHGQRVAWQLLTVGDKAR
jgi:hypothetical protein